jgi:hypothetical protein
VHYYTNDEGDARRPAKDCPESKNPTYFTTTAKTLLPRLHAWIAAAVTAGLI